MVSLRGLGLEAPIGVEPMHTGFAVLFFEICMYLAPFAEHRIIKPELHLIIV